MTNIEFLTYADLPSSMVDELDGWYGQLILADSAYAHVEEWRAADYQLLWRLESGEWASAVELFDHVIQVNGRAMRIGGVSGVITKPDFQGKGYSSELLRESVKILRGWDLDFALLVCKTKLIPFYESLGWEVVEGEIYFQNPDGQSSKFDPVQVHAMIYRFNDSAWETGLIDFKGYPW